MATDAALSEADILGEVIEPTRPTLRRELAEELLTLRFNETSTQRIRDLIGKTNAGTITATEKATLDNYLRVGEFLDLLQAKARVVLQGGGSAQS